MRSTVFHARQYCGGGREPLFPDKNNIEMAFSGGAGDVFQSGGHQIKSYALYAVGFVTILTVFLLFATLVTWNVNPANPDRDRPQN